MKGEVKQYVARVNIIEWIVKKLRSLTGIVEDGDIATHSISAEQYVIWKGNPCKASFTINIGDTLSSSNLTLLTNGIGNDIVGATNSKINNIIGKYVYDQSGSIETYLGTLPNDKQWVATTTNNGTTGSLVTLSGQHLFSITQFCSSYSTKYQLAVAVNTPYVYYRIYRWYNDSWSDWYELERKIKFDSFTDTTSSSGNVGKQFASKVKILSAYSSTGGIIVSPYPGAGADGAGQYQWWFHCIQDNSSNTVYANQSITIYIVYI